MNFRPLDRLLRLLAIVPFAFVLAGPARADADPPIVVKPINPDADPCCDCYELVIRGMDADYVFQPDNLGDYNAYVSPKLNDRDCGSDTPQAVHIFAYVVDKNGIPRTETWRNVELTIGGSEEPTVYHKFTLSADEARQGDLWRIGSACAKEGDVPDQEALENKVAIPGCHYAEFNLSVCEGCANGKGCDDTGEPQVNSGFSQDYSSQGQQGGLRVSIPTTKSFGGQTKGRIDFFVEDFANPGRSGIFAATPGNFTSTHDTAGNLTSVNTGVAVVDVAPADSALLALDPKAFTVTHKNASGTPFRTTTISKITESGISRLRVDTTFDGSITRYEQTNPQPGTLVLEQGRVINGTFEALARETMTRSTPTPGKRVERTILQDRASASASWATSSDKEETYEWMTNGWKKVKEVIDPDGAALTTTWSYYHPGEITGPGGSTQGLGLLKQVMRYDGHESLHTYSLNQTTVISPYAGNPTGRVETATWNPVTKAETSTTTVNGQIISKSSTIHTSSTQTNIVHTSATGTLATVTHYVPSGQDFGGMPVRVVRPDGTITTHAYTRNAGGGFTTVTEEGSTTNGTTVAMGTRTISTVNSRGTTIFTKAEAIGYGTGSADFGTMAVTSIDNLGRALTTAHFPATATVTGEYASATSPAWTTSTEYSCCGVANETDMYGIKTFHAYDHLQREVKTNRLGVTTETVRNGLITETHRYAESVSASLSPAFAGTAATLVSKSVTNLAGTLQESWSPDPTSSTPGALVKSTSTTTYKPATGLSTRTVSTTPDNFSQTTDSFLDGRTATTYGQLSPAMAYSYAVNATGEATSQSHVDGTNLREATTTQQDWAGRTLSTTYQDNTAASVTYNAVGQLVRSREPGNDGVTTLFAYNAEGERVLTAIDLNSNDTIDYGVDTVSFSESEPALDGSIPVVRSISKVWQPGDTNPSGGTVVSTSTRSPNGLNTSSQSIGVANSSTSTTVLSGNGNWSTTSISPDGTKQVQTHTSGLLASSSSLLTSNSALHSTTYGYDGLNRPISTTDSRTGATTTNYLSTTSDVVASVTDPGSRTTAFTYDLRGRRTVVNAPDTLDAGGNTLANVTTTTYNPNSTVAETTGDQTYRSTHTYDYAQRQITLTTYGTTTATTYWHYSPTRGFLTRKAYHDGKGTDYTYTAAGRLSTRAWARGVGTSYAYDNGGRLTSTTYSDDTPDVTVTYDCLGRQVTQSNGVATTTYSHDTTTLALDTETIAYDFNLDSTVDFTRVIDRSRDSLQRDVGWELKDGTTVENSVSYTYGSTDGRLANVTGPSSTSFDYSYLANSNLLESVTGPIHTLTNSWESTRDVLTSKENKVGTTTISSYTYTVNHLGQRTGVSTSGTAFSSARTIDWGYNAKGEVVKADSSVTGFDRAYQYDGIGNRLKSADSLTLPTSNNYTPNALNQYATVGSLNPGYDFDGNMTSGPLPVHPSANSTLEWDAENRLISTTVNSVTTTYQYDSQSRRISQTTGSATTVHVHDGWNPIAEYSGTTLSKTYTWGIDLSGSLQGAGGVGGLLAVTDTTGSYFPTCDGNGNISEYIDSTGTIAAHYEYDSFGNTTVATGSKAADFAHRFSTKPLDAATGLYYYGYRYYDPATGRWPSRDPIEEKGGINLYGFVGNSGVNQWDYLGMDVQINAQTLKFSGGGLSNATRHFVIIGNNKKTTISSVKINGTTTLSGAQRRRDPDPNNNTVGEPFNVVPGTVYEYASPSDQDSSGVEIVVEGTEDGCSFTMEIYVSWRSEVTILKYCRKPILSAEPNMHSAPTRFTIESTQLGNIGTSEAELILQNCEKHE